MGNSSGVKLKIPNKINYKIIYEFNEIKRYLRIGNYLPNEILSKEGDFVLFRKYLTHSDLVNIGKADMFTYGYQKEYILYYNNVKELEENPEKLPTAKQSNITLPKDFYDEINMANLGFLGKWRNIASNYTCLIPKSIKTDFNQEDFEKISQKNGKNPYKKRDLKYSKFEDNATEYNDYFLLIDRISIAAHGIGVKQDKLFYGLRSLMFKGDVLNILINRKNRIMYFIPERNEAYYFILGKVDKDYSNLPIYNLYENKEKKEIIEYLSYLERIEEKESRQPIDEVSKLESDYFDELKARIKRYKDLENFPKYRWYQKQWKEIITKSLALQLNEDYILRCAISGYTTNNKKLEYMFIASHIKSYSECVEQQNWEEAFDPNNGLLLISNVDKLFDKHDISIDDNGLIVKSAACESLTANYSILPANEIGEYYLTERRKKYLEYHYKIFTTINEMSA